MYGFMSFARKVGSNLCTGTPEGWNVVRARALLSMTSLVSYFCLILILIQIL